jgi:hypothetical protein
MTSKPEPFVPPKELGEALAAHGILGFRQRACWPLVRAVKADGVPVVRGKFVRASEAAAWLLAHPDWKPFSTKPPRAGILATG